MEFIEPHHARISWSQWVQFQNVIILLVFEKFHTIKTWSYFTVFTILLIRKIFVHHHHSTILRFWQDLANFNCISDAFIIPSVGRIWISDILHFPYVRKIVYLLMYWVHGYMAPPISQWTDHVTNRYLTHKCLSPKDNNTYKCMRAIYRWL